MPTQYEPLSPKRHKLLNPKPQTLNPKPPTLNLAGPSLVVRLTGWGSPAEVAGAVAHTLGGPGPPEAAYVYMVQYIYIYIYIYYLFIYVYYISVYTYTYIEGCMLIRYETNTSAITTFNVQVIKIPNKLDKYIYIYI